MSNLATCLETGALLQHRQLFYTLPNGRCISQSSWGYILNTVMTTTDDYLKTIFYMSFDYWWAYVFPTLPDRAPSTVVVVDRKFNHYWTFNLIGDECMVIHHYPDPDYRKRPDMKIWISDMDQIDILRKYVKPETTYQVSSAVSLTTISLPTVDPRTDEAKTIDSDESISPSQQTEAVIPHVRLTRHISPASSRIESCVSVPPRHQSDVHEIDNMDMMREMMLAQHFMAMTNPEFAKLCMGDEMGEDAYAQLIESMQSGEAIAEVATDDINHPSDSTTCNDPSNNQSALDDLDDIDAHIRRIIFEGASDNDEGNEHESDGVYDSDATDNDLDHVDLQQFLDHINSSNF